MLPVDEVRLNFNPASLIALNAVLGFLMFGIALDTRVADFKRVARMPVAMAVGIAAQFIVLPAVTFGLTLLLNPAPSIALGMILVACCPPGNISNILTHRAGGNVALSVSMTAISNALSIVVMPLNFAFWGGGCTRALSALLQDHRGRSGEVVPAHRRHHRRALRHRAGLLALAAAAHRAHQEAGAHPELRLPDRLHPRWRSPATGATSSTT